MCLRCTVPCDRDINGAQNIFIKKMCALGNNAKCAGPCEANGGGPSGRMGELLESTQAGDGRTLSAPLRSWNGVTRYMRPPKEYIPSVSYYAPTTHL